MLRRTHGLTLVETLVAIALLGVVTAAFALIARAGGDTSRTSVAADTASAALLRTAKGVREGDPTYLQSPVPVSALPAPAVVTVTQTRASPPTYTLSASSDGVTLQALTTAPGGPR